MKCLVTVNGYTLNEKYDEAEVLVSCPEEPQGPQATVISGRQSGTVQVKGF